MPERLLSFGRGDARGSPACDAALCPPTLCVWKFPGLFLRLPNLSTKDLEKLLEGAGGDVELAVKDAKAPIHTPPALL